MNFIKDEGRIEITEADILEFQRKFDIELPADIKSFYLKYHGCKNYLCTFGKSEEYELSRFLKLTGKNSVEDIKENENEDGFISDRMIPFAMDRGGDYYYWNANDLKIYIIRSDEIETPICLSNSFKEFCNMLNQSEIRK